MHLSLRFLLPFILVACVSCGQKEEQVVATQLVGAWQSVERTYDLHSDHTFSMSWIGPKGPVRAEGDWEVTAMGKAVMLEVKRWSLEDPPPGSLSFFVKIKSKDEVVLTYKLDGAIKDEVLHRTSAS